jgi:hypothetical protein
MTTYKYKGYYGGMLRYDVIEVCECCHEYIHNLLKMTREDVINKINNLGMYQRV